MNKLRLWASLLALLPLFSHADDLRIPARGGGLYQVVVVDGGSNGAAYDGATGTISQTSDGTRICIRSIDFGDGHYGLYNRFVIEYTCPEACDGAYFDIFIEDTATPVASLPVEQTLPGEYVEAEAPFSVNVLGSHWVYVEWRNHAASLRTFGADELRPFATVGLVRTGSLSKFEFGQGSFAPLSGKHRLKMVWKGHNASVSSVRIGKGGGSGMEAALQAGLRVCQEQGGVRVALPGSSPLGDVEVYAPDGKRVLRLVAGGSSCFLPLPEGLYILRLPRKGLVAKVAVCG